MELLLVGFVGVASLLFFVLLFSIFWKPPGEEVRARMEQYLVESEMAAKQYAPPEEDFDEGTKDKEYTDDDILLEGREKGSGVKKVLANVGSIITPKGMAARIAEKLAKADIPLKANEFVAILFLATILPLIIGMFFFKSFPIGIGLAIVGYIAPHIWISIVKSQRIAAFNGQILDTLVMTANGLKAGYSFLQALEMVSRESPAPMSTELRRVLKENSLGLNLEDALLALNRRVESEDWDLVTTVVLIQRQVGGNLAEILDKIGFTIRQRMKIKGDIQTKTAQAKVSGGLVGALPIGIGFMIYLINPGFITKLFTFTYDTGGFIFRGYYVVILGMIWEVIGMYIIMKIVDIEV